MNNPMRIAILPGDGIGPEIVGEAVRVIESASKTFGFEYVLTEAPIGGCAIDEAGDSLPDTTREICLNSDAVLLGAVGGPAYDSLPGEKRPEKGLLRLREALGGFANLRPAKAIDALLGSSPLKRERIIGTDLLIVRELLGGIYFGSPREKNESNALDTMNYSRSEIERVARVAFEAAEKRRSKVTSVDKANVLASSVLWRETVTEVSREYPAVEVEHMYVDACAMHLITDPTQFDVILTGNLFGDILSDEASVLTGSIGTLHSATIGGDIDLYEPIHGSAPDIAGQNVANPIGTINSVAAMMRYTFGRENIARSIENAVIAALEKGIKTADISGNRQTVSTSEMTDHIISEMNKPQALRHATHAS